MIAISAAVGAALAGALLGVRMIFGPTHYDRLAAATSIIWKAALICAAASVLLGQTGAADASLALAAAGFVLNIAMFKFFRVRTFQPPVVRTQEEAT